MTEPRRYRIRIRATLGPEWSPWFDGLELIDLPDGSTLVEGPVADQAALHGILARVRDLALPLISVQAVEPSPEDPAAETAPSQSQEY